VRLSGFSEVEQLILRQRQPECVAERTEGARLDWGQACNSAILNFSSSSNNGDENSLFGVRPSRGAQIRDRLVVVLMGPMGPNGVRPAILQFSLVLVFRLQISTHLLTKVDLPVGKPGMQNLFMAT
jgi:hypothetical protein